MNLVRLARLSAAVVSMGVLSSVSQAQVLTADTITAYAPGSIIANLATGDGVTQTFSGVDQLGLVTFRFLTTEVSTSATNIAFMLTEWSGTLPSSVSTGNAVGSLASTLALPSSSSWGVDSAMFRFFDGTIDLSGFGPISASKTYGITLVGNLDTNDIFLGGTADTVYAGGTAYYNLGVVAGDPNSIADHRFAFGSDFAFSAIGSAAPVPEASSAAVLFAGMFVGGLVVRRRRCRSAGESVATSLAQA